MKTVWNGAIVTDSDKTRVIEGNYYFPPDSIDRKYFKASKTRSTYPWSSQTSYYTLEVDGTKNEDPAWQYRAPREAAAEIKDYIGF